MEQQFGLMETDMKKILSSALVSMCTIIIFASCGIAENGGESVEDNTAWAQSHISVNNASSDVDTITNSNNIGIWTVKIGYSEETEKELSQKDAAALNDILNEENWIEDVTKCESDCVITTANGEIIYYHSSCGTFNDNRNYRSLSATEEETELINSIFSQYGELGTDN